jgi:hypothetical protein
MKCAVCGAENEANSVFCFRCGSRLQPASEPSGGAVTGPTVDLSRGSTPPFGSPTLEATSDEPHARVYDAPATPPSSYDQPAAPPSLSPSSYGQSSTPPAYTVPQSQGQYNLPQNQAQYGYGAPTVPVQNNNALISLILAILSFVVIPLIGAIPAVILGRNARREIAASNGMQTGDGMAQAGVILGWLNIGLFVLGCACFGLLFALGVASG